MVRRNWNCCSGPFSSNLLRPSSSRTTIATTGKLVSAPANSEVFRGNRSSAAAWMILQNLTPSLRFPNYGVIFSSATSRKERFSSWDRTAVRGTSNTRSKGIFCRYAISWCCVTRPRQEAARMTPRRAACRTMRCPCWMQTDRLPPGMRARNAFTGIRAAMSSANTARSFIPIKTVCSSSRKN
jgi:hypothetical protein